MESRRALPKNGAYNIRQLISGLSAQTSGLDNGGGLVALKLESGKLKIGKHERGKHERQLLSGLSAPTSGLDNGGGLEV